MTMTLREVRPTMSEAEPYKHECRGHDPAKKNLLKLMGLALAMCALAHS